MRPLDPRQQLGRHRVGTRDPFRHVAAGMVSLQADQQKGQKIRSNGVVIRLICIDKLILCWVERKDGPRL